ncbi:hypothetical protein TELCIR_07310 [Teladorsagia circumcincta]|uniref:Uncharacterized protein n=1 Tax=Teladorsagia circumcincta TaxID=45464 RepID=A0A2G9UKM3_TELCI|nr:hypothetical protein TELCIR_07310 [Teladorsagia circumcincta]
MNKNPHKTRNAIDQGTAKQFEEALRRSTTVYVGNLSFYTSEDQILPTNSSEGLHADSSGGLYESDLKATNVEIY